MEPSAVSVEWTDLGYSIQVGGARKEILQGCCGQVKAGEVCAVMGPSGAGKTSLMNILAGRLAKGGKFAASIDGQVSLSGKVLDPVAHQRRFAYVMQDDALHATSTPRESVQFSARYRVFDKSPQELDQLVQSCLAQLGLQDVQDSMIGNELIKGLSGGEKKRTSVAIELVSAPKILFLDEPTSGLDSFSAHTVVQTLKELAAKQNACVICTIHQPSSEVFHAFDRCILLAKGRTVFNGPTGDLAEYWATQGHPCPQGYNMADHIMWVVQTAAEDKLRKLAAVCAEDQEKLKARITTTRSSAKDQELAPNRTAGFCTQLAGLLGREVRNTFRDKGTLGARFGSTTFLSVLIALIFLDAGRPESTVEVCAPTPQGLVCQEKHDLQSHMGVIVMLCINGMFGCAFPVLLTFPFERPVFLREASAGMYGATAYFLSKTVVEIPVLLLQGMLLMGITYFAVGLQGPFFVFVGAYSLIGFSACSVALAVGCGAPDAKKGLEAAPLLFVPQIMFAGFFIKTEQIPWFLQWVQYVCFLKWGVNIAVAKEFEDDPEAKGLLDSNEMNPDDVGLYALACLGIMLFGRLVALLALSRKATAIYN